MKRSTAWLPLALLLISSPAWSHPGHGTGLVAGLIHPFTGIDHLLALLAVGLWAGLQKGGSKEQGRYPLLFTLFLLAGWIAAHQGWMLPQVEAGVTASVLVLGLLVAIRAQLPAWQGAVLVAGFALFHGNAHAGDVGWVSNWFLAGLLGASLALQAGGWALAQTLRSWKREGAVRALGWMTVAVGAWLVWN